MDSYEHFIHEMLDKGCTTDGIAAGFAEAMNKMEREKKNKANAYKAKVKEYLEDKDADYTARLKKHLAGHIASQHNDNWTAENVDEFYANMDKVINILEKMTTEGYKYSFDFADAKSMPSLKDVVNDLASIWKML